MKALLHLTLALLLLYPSSTAAAPVIAFEEQVIRVGSDEFVVSILIDANDQLEGHQPLSNGLFSFALKLAFDPAKLELGSDPAFVVSQLNYNGFIPGAVLQTTSSNLIIKGNISLESSTPVPYTAPKLVDVSFRALSNSGTTSLILSSARTNPNESLIVDGQGNSLDAQIAFQTASVQLLPTSTPALLITRNGDGSFGISFDPIPGMNHFLETSQNLAQWSSVSAVPQNSGIINLPSSTGRAFFRLRLESN